MSYRTKIIRFLRHWHARIGVLAAIFFLLLASSGFVLNHTDAFGLAKNKVHAAWLMRWYGLKPDVPTRGYLFSDGYLAAANGRWVMDGHVLLETNQTPVGAITWGNMRALASADHLFLYSKEGQLVDKLDGSTLPAGLIRKLGFADQHLILETERGNFFSDDGLSWQSLAGQPRSAEQLAWAIEQALPIAASDGLRGAFSPSLPLERIILDLHSGRIFGRHGPLLMDIAALILAVLSLSGMWIYWRTVRRSS